MHFWEGAVKVFGELLNDLCAPSLVSLPCQNLFPDAPVKQNKLLIHLDRSPNLRRSDLTLQAGQEIPVALRSRNEIWHGNLGV